MRMGNLRMEWDTDERAVLEVTTMSLDTGVSKPIRVILSKDAQAQVVDWLQAGPYEEGTS